MIVDALVSVLILVEPLSFSLFSIMLDIGYLYAIEIC